MAIKKDKKIFLVRHNGQQVVIQYDDIISLEANGRCTQINYKSKPFFSSRNIGELETILPSPPFLRIHNSFMINVDKMVSINGTTVYLENNNVATVSQRRRRLFNMHLKSKLLK